MGKVMFMTNIGARDLIIPSIKNYESSPRKYGKIISENFSLIDRDIDLPIILPCLKKIIERGEEINKIVLFVTNQEPPHEKDTFYSGKIIKELILNFNDYERLKFLKRKFSEKDIKICEIKENVNDYDEMIKFYEDTLNKMKPYSVDFEKIYISITGGIPACNIGLLWAGIKIFKQRLIPLYVKEGTEYAFELQIGDIILKEFEEKTKKDFINNLFLKGALDLEKDKIKRNLIKYAIERLSFNFEKAKKIMEEIEKYSKEKERTYITKQIKELKNIDECFKINEIYFHMKFKYEMGEYADFLGRFYSFLENLITYFLKNKYNLNFESNEKFIESMGEDLRKYLEDLDIDGRKLKIERNMKVYEKILEFYREEELLNYIKKARKLIEKRNRTIIAHGFEGADEEEIRSLYEGNIFEDTENLLKNLKIYKKVDFLEDLKCLF